MRVRCIATSLSSRQRERLGRRVYLDTEVAALTIGKEYLVLGLEFMADMPVSERGPLFGSSRTRVASIGMIWACSPSPIRVFRGTGCCARGAFRISVCGSCRRSGKLPLSVRPIMRCTYQRASLRRLPTSSVCMLSSIPNSTTRPSDEQTLWSEPTHMLCRSRIRMQPICTKPR